MSKSNYFHIDGFCHCRNIEFILWWPRDASEIPVRQCGCSFCKKHGGAWTSHRDAKLVATIANQSNVTKYNFGTNTADFYVCVICGIVPFVLSEIEDKTYAVVNVNVFLDTGGASVARSPTNFDSESKASRLERRERNWIPNVVVETLGNSTSMR